MNRVEIISSYMRELAGRRQRVDLVCPSCTRPYRGLSWQRYCSNRCRQLAKRQRARQPPAES